MNTVTVSIITYPPAPKGWKGMGFYYEIRHLATYQSQMETVEDLEKEAATLYPQANRINVSDESHPCGWMAGTINFHP